MSQPTSSRAERAANLFDLRRIIGGVMVVWGVLLIILGATDSTAEANKAAGININLWLGIGMLVLGLLFLLWVRLSPMQHEEGHPTGVRSDEEEPDRPRRHRDH